jgi:hypothetical protein
MGRGRVAITQEVGWEQLNSVLESFDALMEGTARA